MPVISMIMPVYNTEKYLSEMLDSIVSQKFTDFELIALNDGSTDNSLSILNEYAKKDKRIRVINKENTGVSDTRNIGLREAVGEYVCFVDSDDVLSDEYLSTMYEVVVEHHADMVVCNYCTFRKRASFKNVKKNLIQIRTDKELTDLGLMTSSWLKLIRKDKITEMSIQYSVSLTYGEDLFFCWKAFFACNNTWFIDKKLYAYRMTADSATSRFHDKLYENYLAAFIDLKEFSKNLGSNNELELDMYFTKRIPSFVFMTVKDKMNYKEKKKRLEFVLSDSIIQFVLNNNWEHFTKNMNQKEINYYLLAKNKHITRLLLLGYKRSIMIKAKGLINQVLLMILKVIE